MERQTMTWLRWTLAACLALGLARPMEPTPPRALWVWDPAQLLKDAAARREFFDFCERHRIGVVWVQIATERAGAGRRLESVAGWKAFNAELHRRDMKVHALDGDPHYARRAQHDVPLSIVDAVIAFNGAASPPDRFDGIHFDNEPYTLLEWRVPSMRERLLADYLDLNARASAKAREAGLSYGVDIPFWWQATDEETGEAVGIVTFRGLRRPATYHLLEMVDNVGIMDYRTTAAGPDGIVANATDTLRQAERLARARVYVGVETSIEHGDYLFLLGVPRDAVRTAITAHSPAASLLDQHRVRFVDDGAVVHVGVRQSDTAAATLAEIARAFGISGAPSSETATAAAQQAFRREGEWLDVRPQSVGAAATLMTPPKVTFADKPLSEMNAQLAESEAAFSAYRHYAGIAIHDYVSFRRIADGARR